MIPIKTGEEIEALRRSAALLVRTFRAVEAALKPGVTTGQLDAVAQETIESGKGIPAFKGYNGYPSTVCVSIDEQVVHGIPGPVRLRNGTLVSVDIGVNLEGIFTDAAKTYAIGDVSPEKRRLMETTREALHRGIRHCRKNLHLSDISHEIQLYVESRGYSVVRELVGHGIGRAMHEEPQIPNFGPAHRGPRLKEGMTLAIEPMVNLGREGVKILEDGWTVVTTDGSPSAHFEHTVLVTGDEPEILTLGIDDNHSGSFNG
jgi:methionyl aminopeptidase